MPNRPATPGLGFDETIRLANYSRTALRTEDVTDCFRETESFGPFSSPVRSSQYHVLYYPGIHKNTFMVEKYLQLNGSI